MLNTIGKPKLYDSSIPSYCCSPRTGKSMREPYFDRNTGDSIELTSQLPGDDLVENRELRDAFNIYKKSRAEGCTEAQLLAALQPCMECPITHQPMKNPVRAPDGFLYDFNAITQWVKINATSPLTSMAFDPEIPLIHDWQMDRMIAHCNQRAMQPRDPYRAVYVVPTAAPTSPLGITMNRRITLPEQRPPAGISSSLHCFASSTTGLGLFALGVPGSIACGIGLMLFLGTSRMVDGFEERSDGDQINYAPALLGEPYLP